MTDNSEEVNTTPANIHARRRALGLDIDSMARAACIRREAIIDADRGHAHPIELARLDAALAALEGGGTTNDARAASIAVRPTKRGSYKRELPEHPGCLRCGHAVRKRRGQTIAGWLAQKYCSTVCAGNADESWPEITDPGMTNGPCVGHDTDARDGGKLNISRPETHIERGNALGGF